MKAYFGKEAREYQQINPKGFEKSFESYKNELRKRIYTFEKKGRGKSQSAKRLREALYDMENSYTTAEKTASFSKASFTLTSARGSYSRSREVDKKIVASLNEQFSIRDPETGEVIQKFITIKELEDFGEMMEAAKDASLSDIYGSGQIVKAIRYILGIHGGKTDDWRTVLKNYLKIHKLVEDR